MEKKEKEELKDRFMNLVVDDKREKITVKDLTATAMMIRNSPPDYSVLLNFIEKELDKAREEGIEKGYKSGWKDSQTLAGLRESEKDTYFDDEDIDELNRLEKIEESI